MKKQIAAAAMGAALLGGGGVTALMTTGASAADSGTSSDSATEAAKQPGAWMTEALAKLVDDGTINQAQADAVETALEAARPEPGPGGFGGRGGPGHGRGGPGLDAAATALGIDAEDLRTALQSGRTIADVAESNNVDLQKVIDAIVASEREHLAEAVAEGRISQAHADERSANAAERATALVNGERPERPDGPPPGAPDAPAEDSNTTS